MVELLEEGTEQTSGHWYQAQQVQQRSHDLLARKGPEANFTLRGESTYGGDMNPVVGCV